MNFFQQIFRRYQQNTSGQQERELVDRWYDATGQEPRPEWMTDEHIHQSKEDAWQRMTVNLGLSEAPRKKHNIINIRESIIRYTAAAIVIGTGIWGATKWLSRESIAIQQDQFTTYTTPTGARKHITLEDGTEVWLNNATSLKILNPTNQSTTREVWITQGEAYFQVTQNATKPFIVHVDSLETTVLGTAFNIQAYRELSKLQISVTEGKVQVGYDKTVLDTLTKNMQLDYNPTTREFATTIKEYNNWKDGSFVLDRADFDELALRIKLRYGKTLNSKNDRIRHSAFSASFKEDAQLQVVLETLCALYNTKYTIKNDIIIIH